MVFVTYFILRGRDRQIDFLRILFLAGVICPMMQEHFIKALSSPRMLLSFGTSTYSAHSLNARHNTGINKRLESQLTADYSRKSLGVKVSNCTLIKGEPCVTKSYSRATFFMIALE